MRDARIKYKTNIVGRTVLATINIFEYPNKKVLNLFQWCRPEASKTTWTKKHNVPCNDGDSCTKSDECKNGQCKGISFTCDSNCQSCNASGCSLHTGYAYVADKCACKIAGKLLVDSNSDIIKSEATERLQWEGGRVKVTRRQFIGNFQFCRNLKNN